MGSQGEVGARGHDSGTNHGEVGFGKRWTGAVGNEG